MMMMMMMMTGEDKEQTGEDKELHGEDKEQNAEDKEQNGEDKEQHGEDKEQNGEDKEQNGEDQELVWIFKVFGSSFGDLFGTSFFFSSLQGTKKGGPGGPPKLDSFFGPFRGLPGGPQEGSLCSDSSILTFAAGPKKGSKMGAKMEPFGLPNPNYTHFGGSIGESWALLKLSSATQRTLMDPLVGITTEHTIIMSE